MTEIDKTLRLLMYQLMGPIFRWSEQKLYIHDAGCRNETYRAIQLNETFPSVELMQCGFVADLIDLYLESLGSLCSFDLMMALWSTETRNFTLKHLTLFRPKL